MTDMNNKNKEKPEAVELPKAEADAMKEKAGKFDEYYDKWLRLQAELENTKKRLDKEKAEFMRFANEDLIIRLLPVIDNFDRALATVKHSSESDAVLEGIRLVQKEFHAILKDYGVEVVGSVGGMFDPHLHEAVAVVETDDYPDDTIVEEVQTGYTLNGRLIRPSVVKVSKGRIQNG